MVIVDRITRRIIGFVAYAGALDGPAVCRIFNDASAGARLLPGYLSSDNDPLFE